MSTNNPGRDNGNDCTEFEHAARSEKAQTLQRAYTEHTQAAVYDFLDALEAGDSEAEAYRHMVARFAEFATRAAGDLEEFGAVDRDRPADFLLLRSIDTTACAADQRHDLCGGFLHDVQTTLEQMEGEN